MSDVDEHIYFLRGLFDETSESGERCNEIADILSRLRADLAQRNAEREALAAELAQRTAERDALKACVDRKASLLHETIRNLQTVEDERDEARREICNGVARRNWPSSYHFDRMRRKYAAERGWDCFKEVKP